MPLDIVIGAQWGDEGKGRIVDLLSADAEYVARYSGGDNAGHTVQVGEQTYKLHLIPSGIVFRHTTGVLGNGMVIHPGVLLQEIERLQKAGIVINPERLRISYAAHLITPGHLALDAAQERARGASMIGTTKRGIGPAYMGKVGRFGLRLGAITDLKSFERQFRDHIIETNRQLVGLYGLEPLDPDRETRAYLGYAKQLQPFVTDTGGLLAEALSQGKNVLAEGAQGTLLDLDHGTYPYVTSSTPTAPGALTGLGLGFGHIGRVIGVTKAFQTRVGEGPFPTEVHGQVAGRLRGTGENPWDEFGTTTGRPRRVGWLDLVLLRYAVRINGLSELVLTKMDILSGFESLRLCCAYRSGEQEFEELPMGPTDLQPYTPVYDELPGWSRNLWEVRETDQLPPEALDYIARIEQQIRVPVRLVSVGPERSQIIRFP